MENKMHSNGIQNAYQWKTKCIPMENKIHTNGKQKYDFKREEILFILIIIICFTFSFTFLT